MFTSVCDNDTTKSLPPYITHPLDIRKKIFVLLDFVHLMKCIRNNWLNLRDQTKTFNYPDLNNNNIIKMLLLKIFVIYIILKKMKFKKKHLY